ncbi:DUF4142 domain-containing protein [Crossiella cryophila]|uniref:Putative outer membrane protein n=1 Tax=Crossiella cryophila TaxID=43355 RepID=A0A7W7CCF9_9PSEU|nr:DUF4142 domain-containing protein [Crossiella cryophila]MBB4678555.1 putative outer membrane protein [Crossiella cryophila]
MLGSCGISATSEWNDSVPGERFRERTTMDAPFGPLYPADIRMLIAVAQAGFWEMPASELMARESANPRVRAVGAQLAREHHRLNQYNEAAAARLNVLLPTSATPQQNAWREQIQAATGAERDRRYVGLTRAAHGSVYLQVAGVRVTTQNDVVRTMAQLAGEYVARHMTLLESTGLADTDSLAVHSGTDSPYQPVPSLVSVLAGAALALVLGFATLLLVQLGSRRRAGEVAGEPAVGGAIG